MAKQGKKYDPNDADREFVRQCIVAGMSVEKTAEALNLSDDTLRKYYRYEIMTSRAVLQGKAVKTLEDALQDGSLDAAKFVLSRVSGWSETTKAELSGPGGASVEVKLDTSQLSDAAIAELMAARKKA